MVPCRHRLFFALLPDADAQRRIGKVAEDLRNSKTIRGSWGDPSRYHLTLQFLGDFETADATIAQAAQAAESVRFPPIDLVLDRVATFGGRFRAPCVLRCRHQTDTVAHALWQLQGDALLIAGLAGDARRYKPHVTIGYGDQALAQPIAIEPIVWRAEEFVLIDSPVGHARHEVIGRWPLLADNRKEGVG